MTQTITVLTPADIRPGATDSEGRVVKHATMITTSKVLVVNVGFENGESDVLTWPIGKGWTVDGRVGA